MLSYTIASLADSDSDGLADTWENTNFGNLDQTGSGDPDNDGLNNSGELTAGTNPTVADTDNDGLNDGAEVTTHTTNPLVADTDGDGVNDGAEIAAGTNPKKTNYSQITVAGGFQGWSPAPAADSSNVMTKVTGDEFGWQLNFRMATATSYLGKFTTGSWDVNWGTSGTPGLLQLGGFGNDIPFNVAATGVYRFYFNTDTLSYSFTRAATPATYAAWAAQYGLAAGSGADDDDVDGLINQDEYSNDSDPLSQDTDGDGLTDNFEVTGFNDYSIVTSPIMADTDGDGLRDTWELQYGLDPTDNGTKLDYVNNTGLTVTANPNGASGNPDGDGLTNLQEQSANSNPLAVGTGFASTYAKLVVAGSFVQTKPDGNWDQVGNNVNTMQLVSNFTWKLVVYVASPLPTFAQFKFTTGSWDTNFGDNIPSGGVADGVGDLNGSNINALPVFTAPGYYTITFNDFSKAYAIAALAPADSDTDGLPDEWEAYYGGFLNPKLTNLVPTTAYVAGSSTTAAQAYAAGTNPVRDTTPPTISLAEGVAKLVTIPIDGALPSITAADVVATDNIGTPTVTIGLFNVNGNDVTSIPVNAPAIAVVTYTATDGGGNTATVQRTVVVGDPVPPYYALNFPATGSISTLGSLPVYAQLYIAGATPGTGQAPNVQCWIGVNTENTDPSTWAESAWTVASHNAGQTGNNDEYSANLSGATLGAGTFYYAARWQVGSGAFRFGGITSTGNGDAWGTRDVGTPPVSTTYGNGTLTVTTAVVREVNFAVDMGVQIFKGTFDPATNGVEVRANFNNFAGGVSLLSREGTSTIYSGTFAVEGAESSTNYFKFFSTGTNAVGYEAGSDRQAILTANGVPMNTGTNFFSGLSESRKITFRVDMSTQIAKGNFNVSSNTVSVAGSFNGWTAVPLSAQSGGVYAAELIVDGPLAGLEYKFVNGTTYEANLSNRTLPGALPNLQASTLDPVLFNNDDGIGPVITRTGDATINLTVGDSYTDAGATATDVIDGSVTVTPSGTVNTAVAGTYTITYNASDAAGNAATPVTRTVIVAAAAGSTFAGWSEGAPLSAANVGKYAIGGASSLSATDGVAPTSTVSGGNLVLTAIVRTDDPKLTVVGEAVASLANYSSGTSVTEVTGSATGIDQTGVPTGCEKQAFTVPQGADSRKFLRLKATLAP